VAEWFHLTCINPEVTTEVSTLETVAQFSYREDLHPNRDI